EEAPSVEVNKEDGESKNTSMTSVLKVKTIWLIAFNVFFVYAVYCGLTFFIPFLKNIYLLPVALVGVYGTINHSRLKP
ncbi:MFS transporter, partial [Escherichia coli]|nr:MFS transporter [Escherichia coli]